jgi:hypothetical protein
VGERRPSRPRPDGRGTDTPRPPLSLARPLTGRCGGLRSRHRRRTPREPADAVRAPGSPKVLTARG